jgi:APA family basic amino acid/polyamine antiporter
MSTPILVHDKRTAGEKKALGLAACTALIMGNMVGSGFYLSPVSLAPYGLLAIVGWIVMGIGAICLGLVFARLAHACPATGGPYAFTRAAYGDFPGFLVAWGYWISIWASLPAIAVAFTGYLAQFVPALNGNRPFVVAVTLGVIWFVVLINLLGVEKAGFFQLVTTFTKLLPFFVIASLGLLWVRPHNLAAFNPSGKPLFEASAAIAPLIMFAYLGMESATVPAGDVRNPERTIPRATVFGISATAVLYILGTVTVMGVIPHEQLARSSSPFSEAASAMWGHWAGGVIAVAALISSLGALNGWTLLMGQVPMAAAQDGLFPAWFGRRSKRGVPAIAIIISATFATVLLLVQASGTRGLVSFYNFIVTLSTMTAVIPYVFCALAGAILVGRASRSETGRWKPRFKVIEIVAFIFAIWTIYGCGAEGVLYGLLLLLMGIPLYVWMRSGREELEKDLSREGQEGQHNATFDGTLAADLPESRAL